MICGHVTCDVASPRGLHQPREQRIANVIGQRRAQSNTAKIKYGIISL